MYVDLKYIIKFIGYISFNQHLLQQPLHSGNSKSI